MSVYNQALIRSTQYLSDRGLLDVMLHTENQIPIYYQYNQPSSFQVIPEKNLIGYASNIREEKGMVICTVTLDDMKSASSNFMGLIDNYTVKTKKTTSSDVSYELIRFVVYDKEFKRKVDEKINEQSVSTAEQPGNTTGGSKPTNVRLYGDSGSRKYTRIKRGTTKG